MEVGHPHTVEPFDAFDSDVRKEEEGHVLEVDFLNANIPAGQIRNGQFSAIPLLHFRKNGPELLFLPVIRISINNRLPNETAYASSNPLSVSEIF